MTTIDARGTVGRSQVSVEIETPDDDDEIQLSIFDYGTQGSVYLSRDEARRVAHELLRVAGGEPLVDLVPRDLIEEVAKEAAKEVATQVVTEQVATIAREHAGREVRRKFRAVINE